MGTGDADSMDEPAAGGHETAAPVPWCQRAYNYIYDRTFGQWDAFRQKYADNGAKVGAAYGVVANNTIGVDVELAEIPLDKLAVDLTDPNSDVFNTGEFRRRQTAGVSGVAKGIERDDPVLARGIVAGVELGADTYLVVKSGQAVLGAVTVTPRAAPASAPRTPEPPPAVGSEPVPGAAMADETAAAEGGIATGTGEESRLVPGGGLAAHEAAGGHTIARHVARTDAELAARLAAEPGINGASTFTDRAVAESAMADTIEANQAAVDAWLQGGGNQLVARQTLGETVGRSLPRGRAAHSCRRWPDGA